MKNENLISVIIPVYNAEVYIDKCIKSVLKQTYSNIEILLIDDCSTDNSFNICCDYMKVHNNIYVFQTEKNSGSASAARNIGLENSNGDYIAFLDSDDFILPTMYENLLNMCLEYNCDIAKCETIDIKNREEPIVAEKAQKLEIYKGIDLMDSVFDKNPIFNVAPCNKLYKKEVFNNIRFPEKIIYEDEAIIMQVLYNATNVAVTDEILYCYYLSPKSVMRNSFSKKRFDIFNALDLRLDFLEKKGLFKIYQKTLVTEYRIACGIFCFLKNNKSIDNKYLNIINQILNDKKFDDILKNSFFSKKYKLYSILCLKFPQLINIYEKIKCKVKGEIK